MLGTPLRIVQEQILRNDRQIRSSAREAELGRRLMEVPASATGRAEPGIQAAITIAVAPGAAIAGSLVPTCAGQAVDPGKTVIYTGKLHHERGR